jgi:CheY-like chemotaxis protein
LTRTVASSARGGGLGFERQPRVLVIDDGPEARELYCAFLEFYGFHTETAEDGAVGLAAARATHPDVIVLDYSMPRMDGEQVLMQLRDDARTRDIPVLMLTAVPELVGRRARTVCTAFLEKPCEPDRLVSAIAAVLREGGQGRRKPRR